MEQFALNLEAKCPNCSYVKPKAKALFLVLGVLAAESNSGPSVAYRASS